MALLRTVTQSEAAFMKMGLFGSQGSGKTWTATSVALGLHKLIGSTKGIAFFDTETGSDPMLPRFQQAGVEMLRIKSRAFKDLSQVMDEAPAVADILIIDSITHVWRELVDSYLRGKKFLDIRDWGPLKTEWAKGYTTKYVNSPLHIIMCGRAGNIYDNIAEEDNPRKFNAVKVGTKMAAETETGYEPNLLVEMEKVYLHDGGKYIRRANVIKERFGVIDSKEFDFSPDDKPDYVFSCFLPHIQMLNLGGQHVGVDSSRSSAALWTPNGPSYAEQKRQQTICWEEIEGVKAQYLPGSTVKEKHRWTVALDVAFGTVSETAIQERTPAMLRFGKDMLAHIVPWMLENEADAPKKQEEFKQWVMAEAARWHEEKLMELDSKEDLPAGWDNHGQPTAATAPVGK